MSISSEMRLFSSAGERLYLTASERAQFLIAAKEESRENRVFCSTLHYTGCRPSELLELTPSSISFDENVIVARSLKKRKIDSKGREKAPQFRSIPVPEKLIDELELVFDLRRKKTDKAKCAKPLWGMSRSTAWRMIKRVMTRAEIEGKQATTKGLRHGFGIAMLTGEKPAPLNIVRDLMGHSDTKTTEIYLQAVGQEKREMVMQAWN
jgi:integrase